MSNRFTFKRKKAKPETKPKPTTLTHPHSPPNICIFKMCSLTTQCSKYQSLGKNTEVVFKCYASLISFCQRDPLKLLSIKLVFASVVHASQAHSVTSHKRLINICILGHATGINLTIAFRKRRNT